MKKWTQIVWISALFQVLVLCWAANGNKRDLWLAVLYLFAINVVSFCLFRLGQRRRKGFVYGYSVLMLLGPWIVLLLLCVL